MSDLIDRQAAIDIVNKYDKSHMVLKGKPMLGAAPIVIELEDLPAAQPDLSSYSDKLWRAAYERGKAEGQPQRMRGRWIPVGEVDAAGNRDYRCSQCGYVDCYVPTVEVNYCWHCGAKMEVEHDTRRGS